MTRKTNSFLTLLLLIFGGSAAQAQITSLTIGHDVNNLSGCVTPSTHYFFASIQGSGSWAALDSFTVYANFGDGEDTTFKKPISWNGMAGSGTVDSNYLGLQHTYTLAGSFNPMITVSAPGGASESALFGTITVTNTCGNLSGVLYVDANGNCVHDAGETVMSGTYMTATNTTTNEQYYGYVYNGGYSVNLPAGATYSLATNGFWWAGATASCPASGTATVNITGTGNYTQDFGFSCAATAPDLSASAWASNFRPGYNRPLYIGGYSTAFCNSVPATISITLDPQLTYTSTNYGTAPTVSGNTLTWNVASLDAFNALGSWMEIYCDPSATLDDTICLTVTITPGSGITETNTANNTYSFCVPINNSMDPNDKSVAPRGMGDEGYIDAQTEGLTYLINFQNMGNDVAYNITIADELDTDIDPASISIVGASHPYTSSISDGNMLKFQFSNIDLPAMSANEPASHGYVMYRARLKNASHQPGVVINNTARIYFDYNAAIVTNTTTNTLMTPAGVQHLTQGNLKATVSPNPANNSLNIAVQDAAEVTATLTDMSGRVIATQQGANGQATIATNALSNGLYLLNVRSGNATLSTKVTVKH